MKKMKLNFLLAMGWVLFAIARIGIYTVGEHNNLLHAFNGFALALVFVGAILQALAYHGVNSKLKHWKYRVIGK